MNDTVKISLKSGNIAAFLKRSTEIREAVDEVAQMVEEQVPSAISATDSKRKEGHVKKSGDQDVFNEIGKPHDRYRRTVGVTNYGRADRVYGTLERAIESAGGRPVGR